MESIKIIKNRMKNKQVNYSIGDNYKCYGLNLPYISKRNFSTNLV